MRVENFLPDTKSENLIYEMNKNLQDLEKNVTKILPQSRIPLVSLCYAPRSGSTLLGQLIAQSGLFNYISNLQARFWLAPYLGGIVAKTLISQITKNINNITSNIGVTGGYDQPHEFGFFWNRFAEMFKSDEPLKMQEAEILKHEINSIKNLKEAPLFIKNGTPSVRPELIHALFPDSYFIIIKRKPIYIAQSIYQSRVSLYGSADFWWSTEPKNADEIRKNYSSPYEQIALQIKGIYVDIEEQASKFNERCLTIWYEDLCNAPVEFMRKLLNLVGVFPDDDEWEKKLPSRLTVKNDIKIEQIHFNALNNALNKHVVTINEGERS